MRDVAETAKFDEWFGELSEDAQTEIIAKVNLLKLLGPQLKRPHADTLKGSKHANMKELRASTSDECSALHSPSTRPVPRSCCSGVTKQETGQRWFYKQLIA